MNRLVSSCRDDSFAQYIRPWSEDFIVKNSDSRVSALSPNYAKKFGFRNPIDFLGESDYSMRCPAVNLASKFIAQDREIIATRESRSYVALTSYSGRQLEPVFVLKEYKQSHVICNVAKLNKSTFSNQIQKELQDLDGRFHRNINLCFEIVDRYPDMTSRETQVAFFLLRGKTAREIAGILNLSYRTVQHHIERIKNKMSCLTSTQLIELLLCLGLFEKIPKPLISY